jgi:crotonobetainyl-CoA:carnitine CoA-transferase CaiB-like acyl-CoA transferase
MSDVGFFQAVDHPTEGRLLAMSVPSSWSDCEPSLRRPAPALGEHTAEILRDAGLSDAEIEAATSAGGRGKQPSKPAI